MIKVTAVGNLTRDPEIKVSSNGTEIGNFGIASNEKYNGKEYTTFVDVTVFGKQAEVCSKYLSKGRKVAISGDLRLDTWEANDGAKRSKLYVVAQNVEFIDSPSNGNQSSQPESKQTSVKETVQDSSSSDVYVDNSDDDIPF